MYQKGEKVVYPGHGVAIVQSVQKKVVNGFVEEFYELRFVSKEMTVLVPTGKSSGVGLRCLSSTEHISLVYDIISSPYIPANHDSVIANWNKRSKKYMGSIRTGDLKEMGAIYHYLRHIERKKELSFGEKKVLEETEKMLSEEISLVEGIEYEEAIILVRSLIR